MVKRILKKLDKHTQKDRIERGLKRIKSLKIFNDVEKVVLFGSAASYEMTEDSDIDFCIIFNNSTDLKTARIEVSKLKREPNDFVPYDILVFTINTFEEKVKMGGVCEIIASDGLTVYQR